MKRILQKFRLKKTGGFVTRFKWKHQVFLYRLSVRIQSFLYDRGIIVHNYWADECTPGLECCREKVRKKHGHKYDDILDAFSKVGKLAHEQKEDVSAFFELKTGEKVTIQQSKIIFGDGNSSTENPVQ